jgi:DNA-binding GntR family transcriptional regulator
MPLTGFNMNFNMSLMQPASSFIVVRYKTSATVMPKHARLRQAIIGAVEAGELPVGTKVTGERELSEELGLSLGTTQKALGRLMDEGFLVRRQGHGTFVGSIRRPIVDSWHFRFLPPDGGPALPVFATILERQLVREDGPWSAALGMDPKGFVMVRRSLNIGSKFTCTSQLYLPATRFSKLLRMAGKRLEDTNLKKVLAKDFSAPTLESEGMAWVTQLDAEDSSLMGIPPSTFGLQVHIIGRSFGHEPISFQRMSVPPTPYALKFDFNPPGPFLTS